MRILITSIIDLKKGATGRLHWFIKYLSKNHYIHVISINDVWKLKGSDSQAYTRGFDIGDYRMSYWTNRNISPIVQEISSVLPSANWRKLMAQPNFDVHFNYNTLVSGYAVAKKMKARGIGTVYDFADDLPKMTGNSPQIPAPFRRFGRAVSRIMLKKNIEIASMVSCPTVNLRKIYQLPENKTAIIPNGVNTQLFYPHTVDSLKRELGLEGCFVVGFVGALREWVDFEPVFSAIEGLSQTEPKLRMLVVGGEVGLSKIKDLARKHGLSEKVRFTGTVPFVQVPDYTCCMDVCVMPLKFDNALPMSFLQYLACSKPVIATRILEIPPGLVIYAANTQEYKQSIMNLLGNPGLREDLGSRGRKFVEQNYTWEKLTNDLEKLLQSVAERS
jgi:glycosyltransferase involved in cell wall biosynthesis